MMDPALKAPSGLPQGFYPRAGKRLFDVLLSIAMLLLLAPVFGLIALLVKLSSSGPVFYRQERVGRNGRYFRIIKFRSMCVDAEKFGPGITASGDRRVTSLGSLLRKCKLDEIPQFWNVLKGDMSLVGPRPEIPCYVESYSTTQAMVLSVRPGITDVASITYRNEEKVLASRPDPEEFYRTVVLPRKLALNLQYVETLSFSRDLLLILWTVLAISTQSENSKVIQFQ